MSLPAQTLRDLIDIALEKHETKSIRKLATIGQQAGFKITQPTLWGIHGGTYRNNPTAPTLEAIAYLAGVPVERAYAAAELPVPGIPFEAAPGADQLTPRQRDVVNSVIRALLDAQGLERASDHSNVESETSDTVAYVTEEDYADTEELTQTDEAR